MACNGNKRGGKGYILIPKYLNKQGGKDHLVCATRDRKGRLLSVDGVANTEAVFTHLAKAPALKVLARQRRGADLPGPARSSKGECQVKATVKQRQMTSQVLSGRVRGGRSGRVDFGSTTWLLGQLLICWTRLN